MLNKGNLNKRQEAAYVRSAVPICSSGIFVADISEQPHKNQIMSSHHSSQSRGSSNRRQQFRRSRSIKSDDALDIQGPLDIQGSVKSGGSISFAGDFIVKDKIDAYGAIDIDGNVKCESVKPHISRL